MVKNLREKRSTVGAGISERPRRSVVLEQQHADNSNLSSASTKKARSSIARRVNKDQPSDFEDTDQDNVKDSEKSNESNFEDDEDTRDGSRNHQKCQDASVDDEDYDQSDTILAESELGETGTPGMDKRKMALVRARQVRSRKKKRRSGHKSIDKNNSICFNETQNTQNNGPIDLTLSQKYVQVNHVNRVLNLNAFEDFECDYEIESLKENIGSGSTTSTSSTHSNKPAVQQPVPQLPKVNIQIISDVSSCTDLFNLPINYIKFVEKTNDELDEEVEYDMDEEDNLWLQLVNEQRSNQQPAIIDDITQEQFEILMDRLEKESYFQTNQPKSPEKAINKSLVDSSLNGSRFNDSSNEDASCCICLDGEGYNSNAILFCDMCNLAVHQECYGVPYIPEGQWLCRRCIQSPSAHVQCILCPNSYGAFKQTDGSLWSHVVCAIWIPEVHFANTVFLEPVIGIENIDRARWKLMCYICRKRNVGACIQCDKFNCYTAFHVTCAQQAGLYMNIREEMPIDDGSRKKKNGKKNQHNSSSGSLTVEVRRCAYCDIHTPLEVLSPRTRKSIGVSSNTTTSNMGAECEEAMKQAQKLRMKKARKILAERRMVPPQVCMPAVPKEKTEDIISRVNFENKEEFFQKLTNYWLLKRYSRNGVPILRRLQTMGLKNKKNEQNEVDLQKLKESVAELNKEEKSQRYDELKEQRIYWKTVRNDLERARLLVELIRKRERIKRESIRIDHLKAIYETNPLNGIFLQRLLDSFREIDRTRVFHEPVDGDAVPTYYSTIKKPMDFSTMQTKLNEMKYENLSQFEADFNQIISNCVQFNQKKSHYYNLALKIKDQATNLIKQAKRIYSMHETDLALSKNSVKIDDTDKK